MMTFPHIDPVAIEIFGLPIRWYGLAYVAGFLLGFQYLKLVIIKGWAKLTIEQLDNLFIYVIAGVILGGRLGYVLFYQFDYYLANPSQILQTWQGGMSFHGGLVGVILAFLIFAWRNNLHPATVADTVAPAIPIGLFFGRIANFINAELYGRPTDLPWAMIFPTDPTRLPRHPSQLYEALLEGLLLFVILHIINKNPTSPRWRATGTFLVGYAIFRFSIEYVRQPDALAHLQGGIYTYITQGQLLCIPMLLLGVYFLTRRHA